MRQSFHFERALVKQGNTFLIAQPMGTQKNLNKAVTLNTQNICKKLWVRKYLQFYIENSCLSKPVVWGLASLNLNEE